MLWFKKSSYNLFKAKENKSPVTLTNINIKGKKPTASGSNFRSSFRITFQSYLKPKKSN